MRHIRFFVITDADYRIQLLKKEMVTVVKLRLKLYPFNLGKS